MVTRRKEFDFCEDVENFLKMKNTPTEHAYRSGLVRFKEFYQGKYGKDATISEFLDRVSEDMKKPAREQKRLAESELNGFIDYLTGLKPPKSPNSIIVYISAVQNLMKFYHLPLSVSFIKMPKSVVQENNRKHEWTLENMKEFFEKATNYRDKALILSEFQSGLGVAEVCNLNYGDVKGELERETLPLCLRIVRKKTGVDYRTFLGRDAVHYLKLYLKTREGLTEEDPLFAMLGTNKRMTEGAIEASFRKIAEKCDFIRKSVDGYNPARPHSLRSAFRSRLTGKMDGDLIEYFMGHTLNSSKSAYIQIPTEELRELYGNYEHLLSIEKTSKDEYSVATDEGKQFSELKTKIRNLEETITHLSHDMAAQQRLIEHFYEATGLDPEILQKYMLKAKQESLQKQDAERQEEEEKEKLANQSK